MDRKQNYFKGILAEYLAALFLLTKGYMPKTVRYKTKVGEIDLIVQKGRLLVFIEVKYRKDNNDALEAVTQKTKDRISKAAKLYLQKNPQYQNLELRFDVVSVSSYGSLKHIKNAWFISE